MQLSELITRLNIQIDSNDEPWSILGPEADALAAKLKENFLPFSPDLIPQLKGLLLAGALSAMPNAQSWLEQTIRLMAKGATLIVIDWQDDGPLHHGPEFEMRFKKGKLCRMLRESGFGFVEVLDSQPTYYVVKGIKGPPPPIPHADEFVDVAGLEELPKNAMKPVEIFGHKIIVANTGQEIVAFAQSCPHANSLLNEGLLRGRNVVCPLHGYMWNVRTGQPVEPPDEDSLPRYSIRIDEERRRVLVALAPP